MLQRRTLATLRDQAGIALPLALIVLMLLVSLTVAFAVMGGSEPLIASNHQSSNQAQYFADSGVEAAVWALTNPTAPNGIPTLTTVPARYSSPTPHGSTATFIAFGQGGFTLTVAAVAGNPTQAQVTSTGWLPNNTVALVAKKIVTTKLLTLQNRFNPPASLNVNGDLTVGGSAFIDSRNATCQTSGWQLGALTTGATSFLPTNPQLYGSQQPTPPPGYNNPTYDYVANQPPSAFAPLSLTPEELLALKARAQAAGTYFKGSKTFDPSAPSPAIPLPNGIVFVDTVSGAPIGTPPNPADLASVTINGGTATGMIIVMGSITVAGTSPLSYTGLVYAANGFTWTNTGTGTGVRGAVISGSVTAPVSSVGGTAKIYLDCDAINNGTGPNWVVVPGTWRELGG